MKHEEQIQFVACVDSVFCGQVDFYTKSRLQSLLSGVYARGSKRSRTGDKYVTCCGINNSTWSIMSTRR